MLYFFPASAEKTKYPSIFVAVIVFSPFIDTETPEIAVPVLASVTFPSIFPVCASAINERVKKVSSNGTSFMQYLFTAKRQQACYVNMN